LLDAEDILLGKTYDELTPEVAEWIGQQRVFFVATAPLAADGLINCSPKGMDTFRMLGPREAAYLDLTGSGVETAAHLRENGRIVLMFCALSGPPNVLRLHGTGEVLPVGSAGYAALQEKFPDLLGARAIVRVRLSRIGDSCGYAVPQFEFVRDRDTLVRWAENKGAEGLVEYRRQKNARSLDGLPGLEAEAKVQ
jgi:hypothetical protein